MANDSSGFSVPSYYFSIYIQERLKKSVPQEGSIGIQYIDGLLVESETKVPSQNDAFVSLQWHMATPDKVHPRQTGVKILKVSVDTKGPQLIQ